MLHSYVLSSILTLSFTYSWYSFNGFWKRKLVDDVILGEVKSSAIPNIPIYMWDAYNKGVNSSEVDVIKSIFPKFLGPSRKSWSFQNHRRKEVEFDLPKSQQSEKLVKAKIRLITSHIKVFKISFQVYVKANKWVFLDEKKNSNNTDWVSLDVTAAVRNTNKSSINFLILVFTEESGKNCCEPLHPVLVLFYYTLSDDEKNKNRRKRSLSSEEYEEKTNMIWEEKLFTSHKLKKINKSNCRRKSLYIKFSDIDYDSWIVAPTGYEAFQCVGKCTFPLTEHLSPTKHAILQTLLHNISPSKAPRACCVPTKLEPISILYIDGNGVLTYRLRYRDMVVAECGCR